MSIPIFILHWGRIEFTRRCIRELKERTRVRFELHLWCNEYQQDDPHELLELAKECTSIHLDRRNTCCWFPKGPQHMMVPADTPYYVLNDADYYPPDLKGPCWLERLVTVMDRHKQLGCLAAQLPPQWLQTPSKVFDDYVQCKAVGNSLRVTRRTAWPQGKFEQKLGQFGDDSILCQMMLDDGYITGFARDVYCLHAGQCENWGYQPEEVHKDPRKAGYGKPYVYEYDPVTYEPTEARLRL